MFSRVEGKPESQARPKVHVVSFHSTDIIFFQYWTSSVVATQWYLPTVLMASPHRIEHFLMYTWYPSQYWWCLPQHWTSSIVRHIVRCLRVICLKIDWFANPASSKTLLCMLLRIASSRGLALSTDLAYLAGCIFLLAYIKIGGILDQWPGISKTQLLFTIRCVIVFYIRCKFSCMFSKCTFFCRHMHKLVMEFI